MTAFCVGCDNIVGGESGIIDRVAKVLEKAGHTCERLSVGPNFTQSKGMSSSSKGKVAVFIVGGSDIGTYVDFRDGIKNGYYHYKFAWFAFASWTAHSWITEKDLKNRPLVRAHDDNFSSSSSIAPFIGKSADYFFQQNKTYVNYVYGQSPEELAKKILGGGDSSDEKKESTGGSIKDAIKKLLSHWDTDVECYIRGDEVHINKIRDPEKYYEGEITEGVNVFSDSISLTDINSNTPNYLEVEWTKGTITIQDEDLIDRFGEIKKTMTAVKKIVSYETVTKTTTDTSASDTSTTDDASATDTATDTGTDTATDTGTTGTDTATDTGTGATEETTTKKTVTEVPIDNYDEAYEFAMREWNKLKRENGRTLECQVLGANRWNSGSWLKVNIPTFNLNTYMYVSRTSQTLDGNDWTCNISLVDYPPSFGEEELETTDEDTESEDGAEASDTGTEETSAE